MAKKKATTSKKDTLEETPQLEKVDPLLQRSAPDRYVLQGTHGFVGGAPGRNQCVVYDLRTRQMVAVLSSPEEAKVWAGKRNREFSLNSKVKPPRKP